MPPSDPPPVCSESRKPCELQGGARWLPTVAEPEKVSGRRRVNPNANSSPYLPKIVSELLFRGPLRRKNAQVARGTKNALRKTLKRIDGQWRRSNMRRLF